MVKSEVKVLQKEKRMVQIPKNSTHDNGLSYSYFTGEKPGRTKQISDEERRAVYTHCMDMYLIWLRIIWKNNYTVLLIL